MEKYNRKLFINYTPSSETYDKALILTEKLGKINNRMRDLFVDYKIPSKLFAFIESKYSSKIEGIYTTLFDVVNTGVETNQKKIIGPLVNALLNEDVLVNQIKIDHLAKILNDGKDKTKRHSSKFGIWNEKNHIKIYEPPSSQKEIDSELKVFWNNIQQSSPTVIDAILSHLFFEKIHPYVDGNGRIGRLLLNRMMSQVTNFSNLLPFSWAIYRQRDRYYDAFMFNDDDSLDKGVRVMFDIALFMYNKLKGFIMDLQNYFEKFSSIVNSSSSRTNEEMTRSILFTLQTKQSYMVKHFNLNPRTVTNIFNNIKKDMDFNVINSGREKLFWNAEIETIIDRWFGE